MYKILKILILNQVAPHIFEDPNEKIGYGVITSSHWLSYDEELIFEENITPAVQFNKKTRGTIEILKDAKEADLLKMEEETLF